MATLPPMATGTGLTMKAHADVEEIIISDVAIGEVWIGGVPRGSFLIMVPSEFGSAPAGKRKRKRVPTM